MDQDFVNVVLTTKGTQITNSAYQNDIRINLRKNNCLIYTNTIYFIKKPSAPLGVLPSGVYFFQIELANALPSTVSGNGTTAKLLISFATFIDTSQSIIQYTPVYPPSTVRRTLKISENEKWHMEISNEIPQVHPLLEYYDVDIECTIIVPENPRSVPSAISSQNPLINAANLPGLPVPYKGIGGALSTTTTKRPRQPRRSIPPKSKSRKFE
jgi:hypothetical protein